LETCCSVPIPQKIADLERAIEDTLGAIAAMRAKNANQTDIDPLWPSSRA